MQCCHRETAGDRPAAYREAGVFSGRRLPGKSVLWHTVGQGALAPSGARRLPNSQSVDGRGLWLAQVQHSTWRTGVGEWT